MQGPPTTPPPPGKRWHTREDSGLRLDRQLRWFHDGEPIEHPKIIEAFNRGLTPTEDGRFRLNFGWDWCYVEVEDAAYGVTGLDVLPDGVALQLTDRTTERLDPRTLAVGGDGALTCKVKEGRAKARFSRDSQFALGELLEEQDGRLFLRAGNTRVPLELTLDALA